ncbi:glycosyltransferase family 2 protein [Geomonas sp. Red32]|uniref:glycosyltransferase family A protein n=1 Tax=Geomonas sp. Red32 TaxID=2912856 RepID=UPI00202CCEF9|nr:glycosyltransferase family A protein [Geomonas sp. Red32]MCM0082860.1 glycosyltransferase family 2 protein [Geomonas sp. Red32]
MEPLVSILIPAFNAEKWIEETLTSAVNQSWPKKEVIVVDDGSTDATREIASHFQSTNVKIVTQENAGACAARNRALSIAQGDFVQWLDADDLLVPDKIERQLREFHLQGDDSLLYCSGFGTFFYRTSKARLQTNSLWHDLRPVDWYLRKFNHDDSLFPAVWLVSRRLTDAVGPWDVRLTLNDDGEYFGRLVAASHGVKFVSGAYSLYRQANAGSLSKVINHRACRSLQLSYRLLIDYLLRLEDSVRARSAALRYLQTNLIYFYPEERLMFEELSVLAEQLGGTLSPPQLGPKFSFLIDILGFKAAKGIASAVRGTKQSALILYDRYMRQVVGDRPLPSFPAA